MRDLLLCFLITLRGNDLKNISLIEIWNLRNICQHIDRRWGLSLWGFWGYAVPYSNAIIFKTKKSFSIFSFIYGISIKFWKVSKKRWLSELMYIRNYRLSKTWLNHSLESTVSEHLSTVNMLKSPKHLWIQHENSFIIFFHQFDGN